MRALVFTVALLVAGTGAAPPEDDALLQIAKDDIPVNVMPDQTNGADRGLAEEDADMNVMPAEDRWPAPASRAGRARLRYNSNEHMDQGDKGFETFFGEVFDGSSANYLSDNNIKTLMYEFSARHDGEGDTDYLGPDKRSPLRFGDLLAMSGDYYSDMNRAQGYEKPGVQNDMSKWALGEWDPSSNSYTRAEGVEGVNKYETFYQDLDSSIDAGVVNHDKLPGSIWGLLQYLRGQTEAKAASNSQFDLVYYHPDYMGMATVNFDHFGPAGRDSFVQAADSSRKLAYAAGQAWKSGADPSCESGRDWTGTCTMSGCLPFRGPTSCEGNYFSGYYCMCKSQLGKKACAMGGNQCRYSRLAWTGQLRHAIEFFAFGSHFFADQFSAGHLRVPYSSTDTGSNVNLQGVCTESLGGSWAPVGGLLTKKMHDEDDKAGLEVKNAQGTTWKAFGDSMWFDDANSQNRDVSTQGLAAALHDVWDAFMDGAQGKTLRDSQVGTGSNTDPLTFLPVVEPSKSEGGPNNDPLIMYDAKNDRLLARDSTGYGKLEGAGCLKFLTGLGGLEAVGQPDR